MKYTEEQLKYIQLNKPELIKKTEPNLNDAIVEFLKKYKLFVKPPKKKLGIKNPAYDGIKGPDVAGDNFFIKGKKQTHFQEWIKCKQWALDHKDFPKFQTEFFNEIYEYNENIDKKFENPEYQKFELDPLIQANEKKEKLITRLILILLILVFGVAIIGNVYIYLEDKNDRSSIIHKTK